MTYSAWDWNRRQFAVYTDERQRPFMADPQVCRPATRAGVGGMIDVNQTLCPLPPGAQPLGWSEVAIGQVVRGPTTVVSPPGRAPSLGGLLFAPRVNGLGAAAGVSPGLGALGEVSFGEAVMINVLVSVIAGVVSTFVFKSAFVGAGKKI